VGGIRIPRCNHASVGSPAAAADAEGQKIASHEELDRIQEHLLEGWRLERRVMQQRRFCITASNNYHLM